MEIRETRPWFWLVVGALAAVAIGALVIAISASNEAVDQKKVVEEASDHVVAKVAGLSEAVKAADELQAEGKERSEADRKQIQQDVEEAVAGGEAELAKVRRRVARVEDQVEGTEEQIEKIEGQVERAAAVGARSEEDIAGLAKGQEGLEREVEGLDRQLGKLENEVGKKAEQAP